MMKPFQTTAAAILSTLVLCTSPANAQWWKALTQQQQQYYPSQTQMQTQTNVNYGPVSDALKNVERSAQMLAPRATNPSIMMSLSALKDTARQARRYADDGNSSQLMMKLSELQVVASNAVTVAQRSGMDSFTTGQLQMIQGNVQQALTFASAAPPVVPIYNPNVNPYNPYNPNVNPYNPNPYNPYPYNPYAGQIGYAPGVMQAVGTGRGQFVMMGQTLMGIKQASLSCMDPVARRATFTISQGPAAINLTGTVTAQTPSSATIAINGSDRGAATGMMTAMVGTDGSLMSANGNGTLNGQPFSLSFKGN